MDKRRESIIDVIEHFVVDEDLAKRAVWEAYAEEYGVRDLFREMARIIEPWASASDDDEVIQKFRNE